MKNFLFFTIAFFSFTVALANTIKNNDSLETLYAVEMDQNALEQVDVLGDKVGPECKGNILILDSRGNVINNIPFSASTATSLSDCIGLYQFAVYQVTLKLNQGETTGGTVEYK